MARSDVFSYNTDIYSVKKTNKFVNALIYVGLVVWLLIDLFPLYYLFTFSLKSSKEITGTNVIGLPQEWLWSNYARVFQLGKKTGKPAMRHFFANGGIEKCFSNSVLVAVATIAICLIAGLMATYAITRIAWKGSKTLNSIFMLGITIPMHVALYPIYSSFGKMGILHSYASLIIPYAAFSLSMAIMVCTGFMNDIPKELDESACIDGCGSWGIFFHIIVPLMKPALATMSIYIFLQCWNEFMFSSVFGDEAHYTLPVFVSNLKGSNITDWGLVGAGLVLATFPMLITYVFMSRRIQESFMVGAVKG
ncbi:raffinose/stachyose/melibiose transport system permease protein [Lachnospiraceae bacterium XBB2008]|nr:raffinose/stachyose/melibiose transport system permease protein [Lachnospiraceae bacterium XBB2008]